MAILPVRADTDFQTVIVSRRFRASRERIFKAWTEGEEFRSWWRPDPFETTSVRLDARTGGTYEIVMQAPDGRQQILRGQYLAVEPVRLIVKSWALEGSENDDGYEAIVKASFMEIDGGTELVVEHSKLPSSSMAMFQSGWELVLGQLAESVETEGNDHVDNPNQSNFMLTELASSWRDYNLETKRMLRSTALASGGKAFAFVQNGSVVVKLSLERASTLVLDGMALPYHTGARPMRQWISIPIKDTDTWRECVREAFEFARGQ